MVQDTTTREGPWSHGDEEEAVVAECRRAGADPHQGYFGPSMRCLLSPPRSENWFVNRSVSVHRTKSLFRRALINIWMCYC